MSKTRNVVIDDQNKQQTIQYLTDLMATIQMAYFKGRLGERNGDNTGGDGAKAGDLWVHESAGDAAISIGLYDFGGDGKPVCEGLTAITVSGYGGKEATADVFAVCYDPDRESHPLTLMVNEGLGDEDSDPDTYDVTPDLLPEQTLKNIAAWLEETLLRYAVVKYCVMQITDDSADARFCKFSDTDDLRKLGLAERLTLAMYGTVYEGETARTADWLDDVYARFQGSKPEGYTGHSLSVSDIVAADGRYYYCDGFGWTEVSFDPEDGHIILPEEKETTN